MTASTALVTGASGGIGLHIARGFAEQGWTVLVGARDAARGAEAAAEIGGRPVLLDVTDPEAIARAAASVPELDVLVNNAGISLDTGARVTETDDEVFRRSSETNVFGVIHFVEDNRLGDEWIGDGSYDALSGPLTGMLDFAGRSPRAPKLFLDPNAGKPVASQELRR